jgi:uncharacterized protein (DUF2252 family)
MEIVERIAAAHHGRDPERVALKLKVLAKDPHAFYRGAPFLFYEDLPGRKESPELHAGPRAWLCGDAHLENFGSCLAENRLTYFDFNDFDEACLGPPAWDLLRLLGSCAIAARMRGFPAAKVRGILARMIDSYQRELTLGKSLWLERDTATGLIRDLLDSVRHRKPDQLIRKRTTRGLINLDGKKALPEGAVEKEELRRFVEREAPGFTVLDSARRIAGNSSLGLPRYVILARCPSGAEALLDLKAAPTPVPLRFHAKGVRKHQPEWANEAERVVRIQNLAQAAPPAFLRALGCWVLRELLPSEDRVSLASATDAQFDEYVQTVAALAAWMQLRSSGRLGSASADELGAFGANLSQWIPAWIRFATSYAATNERRHRQFVKATGQNGT